MSKRTLSILILATSFFLLTLPALAITGSIASTSEVFSPNTGTWEYINNTVTDVIKVNLKNLQYSSSRMASIWTLYDTSAAYPGVDVKDTARSKGQLEGYLVGSNYPNAYYDFDDDNGDGLDDEIEVVSRSPNLMKANYSYWFNSGFTHEKSSGTGQLLASAQHSIWNFIFQEYDVFDWEALKYINYDISTPVAFNNTNQAYASEKSNPDEVKKKMFSEKNSKGYSVVAVEENNAKVEIMVEPDKDNLDNYVLYNKKIAQDLALKKVENIPVAITFNRPLSIDELCEFESKYNFKLSKCFGRAFVDKERVSFAGTSDDFKSLDFKAIEDIVSNEDNKSKAEVAGIYCIYGTLQNAESLVSIIDESEVYLADVVQNVIKDNMSQDSKLPVEIEVNSPYWYIEE